MMSAFEISFYTVKFPIIRSYVINERLGSLNPISFGQQKCAPKHYFGPGMREHYVIHFVLSGTGIFKHRGKTFYPKAGDLFIFHPFEKVYYEADANDPWHYVWAGFSVRGDLPQVYNNSVIHCPTLKTIFKDMLLCKNYESGRSAYLSHGLWEITASLLENEKQSMNYVEQTLHYFHATYSRNLDLEEIASLLNINKRYLITLFTKEMGISPYQYLIKLRLNKAIELLVDHKQPATIVAQSVGCQTYSHFSKLFKQYVGVSPSDYQKQALERGTYTIPEDLKLI